MTLRSRIPASARLSVRGIGVADSVRTSTSRFSCFSRSLAATPKRCSSSTTTSPRSLNRTSFESSRWVPITRSTGPVGEARHRRGLGRRRDEARQEPDLEREGREPLRERGVVLGGEHGRRHEDGHLLAVLDRLERRPQRHLGLAVADVADDQPVHRPGPLHVRLDLDGGAQLVDRLLVRERRLHLRLPGRVVGEGVAARPARAAYSSSRSSARSSTALRTRCLARSHSVPPSLDSAGRSPPE